MKHAKIKPSTSAAQTLPVTPKRSQLAVLRKLFPDLLSNLANGQPLDGMLVAHGIDWKTFHRYLDDHPERRQMYSRARRYCVEKWVSEIVPMSDAVIGEEMNVVTATRNAVDARKWVAGKLAPREYGDQPAGVTINNTTNVAIMTDDRLRALQETRKRLFLEQAQTPTLPA